MKAVFLSSMLGGVGSMQRMRQLNRHEVKTDYVPHRFRAPPRLVENNRFMIQMSNVNSEPHLNEPQTIPYGTCAAGDYMNYLPYCS